MKKNYYLGINTYGKNRAFEPYNGWAIIAFKSIAERNKAIEKFDFINIGVTIITRKEVDKIMDYKKWYIDEYDIITTCPF